MCMGVCVYMYMNEWENANIITLFIYFVFVKFQNQFVNHIVMCSLIN